MRIFSRRLRRSTSSPHRHGQPAAHRPDRRRVGVGRLERGVGVGDDDPCRSAAPRRGRTAGTRPPELAHVEVVDDLVDEVGRVLDERDVGLDVAGDAEPAQHVLAEAVGGGDRRGVEVGERGGEAAPADARPRRRDVGEEAQHVVVRRRRHAGQDAGQPVLGADEPLAHPRPQLAGGHPAERHEQHVLERRALGDVAGGEGGDGERLAGAGARLEHRDAGRQRPADVERGVGVAHRFDPAPRAASSPSHSRRA